MTLAGDSVLVTPGSGATIATHIVAAKEHQVIMQADAQGHILGTKDTYCYKIAEQVHVAAASTIHWDMFNADAALIVRVPGVYQLPGIITAVTGVVFTWTFQRTTAVGTGGSAQTAWLADLSQAALDADITCRSKPSGGATPGVQLSAYSIHGEETNAASQMMHMMMIGGVANLVPKQIADKGGIVLRQNQGLSITQTLNSAAGNTGWLIVFTVE